jgi:hypothetical protein
MVRQCFAIHCYLSIQLMPKAVRIPNMKVTSKAKAKSKANAEVYNLASTIAVGTQQRR